MIKLEIIGNLTRDPEVRTLQSGSTVTNFTVASNRRVNGKDFTDYVNISAFEAIGENCAKYLSKGKKVYVEGRPSARGYTSKDGSIRASIEVIAGNVEFLSPKDAPAEPAPATEQTDYSEVDEDDELPF